MVAAELRIVPHVRGYQKLVVQNYGPSIARDVRVAFDPALVMPVGLPNTSTGEGGLVDLLIKRYAAPIPTLTPGAQLEISYYVARPGPGGDSFVNGEPLPDQVTVTITFTGDNPKEKYVERFPLDTDLLRWTTKATSSASPEAQLKLSVKALEGLSQSVKSLAESGRLLTRRHRAELDAEQRAQQQLEDEQWRRNHPDDPLAVDPVGAPARLRNVYAQLMPWKAREPRAGAGRTSASPSVTRQVGG